MLQGLEIDPITGYVVARPPSSEWQRLAADQEAWAAQVGCQLLHCRVRCT